MKIKVSELEGAKLDYWVARAEGWEIKQSESGFLLRKKDEDGLTISAYIGCYIPFVFIEYSPSSDWSQGGPILEREAGTFGIAGNDQNFDQVSYWAEMGRDITRYRMAGPTHLIAAMRAYVASKFGEEVEG